MSDSVPNNPADRLRELLLEAQGIPGKTPVKQGWHRLLDVAPDNDPLLLERMGAVLRLPRIIRKEVEAVTDEPERFIDQLGGAERALNLGLKPTLTWDKVLEPVHPGVLEQLRHAGRLLGTEVPERGCERADVAELHQTVREIYDGLTSGGFDKDVRNFLLPHVLALDHALSVVKADGCAGIGHAATAAIGGWLCNQVHPPPGDSKARRLWHSFWGSVGKCLKYASYAGIALQGLTAGADVLAGLPLWDQPQLEAGETVGVGEPAGHEVPLGDDTGGHGTGTGGHGTER